MDRQLIEISSSTILRVILIVLALVFLWFIRDIVLMLLLSIVIASAVDPAASWLQARRIPRALGVLAVYLLVVVALGSLLYLLVPPLVDEIQALAGRFPRIVEEILGQLANGPPGVNQNVIFDRVEDYLGALADRLPQLSTTFGRGLALFAAQVTRVVGGITSTLFVLVISFYLAVREKGIENFLRSVAPAEHEAYVVGLWQRSQRKMGLWARGQLMLSAIVGLTVYAALTIIGVPFAVLLALLAALLEFVPMVGPVLAAVPAVIIAFFQGFAPGILTLALYVVIQPLENHILVPQIMRRTLGLSPVIIILALLVGAKLAGIIGMLLALPIAAALNELFNDLTERQRGPAV